MKKNNLNIMLVALGLFAFSGSMAQDVAREKLSKEEQFAKMDTDANGFIDKAEFTTASKDKKGKGGEEISAEKIDEMFAKIDTSNDQLIDLEEFKAMPERGRKGKGKKRN